MIPKPPSSWYTLSCGNSRPWIFDRLFVCSFLKSSIPKIFLQYTVTHGNSCVTDINHAKEVSDEKGVLCNCGNWYIYAFYGPVAFSQDLDGIWFKVTYTAKGNIEGANEAIGQKQQAKVVNYIQLVYNDVWSTRCPGDFSPFYEIHTWYPDGNVWDYDNGAMNKDDEACYGTHGCPYQGKTFLDKQFVFYAGSGNILYYRGVTCSSVILMLPLL